MTVREILEIGDPLLEREARPVQAFDTPALHELVADLFDTLRAAGGVGLAASQIGVDLAVTVFEVRKNRAVLLVPKTVLINPRINPLSEGEEAGWESCLSVPGLVGMVPRHRRIRYTGFDAHGRRIEREADGLHARVVQHECDHLSGTLYPSKVPDPMFLRRPTPPRVRSRSRKGPSL